MPTSVFSGGDGRGLAGQRGRLGPERLHDLVNFRVDLGSPVGSGRAHRIETSHRDDAGIAIVELVGLVALHAQGLGQLVGLLGGVGQLALHLLVPFSMALISSCLMITWPLNVATCTVYLPGQSKRLYGTPLFIATTSSSMPLLGVK